MTEERRGQKRLSPTRGWVVQPGRIPEEVPPELVAQQAIRWRFDGELPEQECEYHRGRDPETGVAVFVAASLDPARPPSDLVAAVRAQRKSEFNFVRGGEHYACSSHVIRDSDGLARVVWDARVGAEVFRIGVATREDLTSGRAAFRERVIAVVRAYRAGR